jgi:AcrR family transcriptional regulator
MPYPAQVNHESILTAARELCEADGYEALSLAKLASVLGIKAPSLYNHFASKTELVRALNLLIARELVSTLLVSIAGMSDAAASLMRMAHEYRAYVHRHPVCYRMTFSNPSTAITPERLELERLALPLQAVCRALVGDAGSLTALRGLQALIHGFVMLEMNGQFRRGGDLDAAFTRSVQAYIEGWQPR